MPDLGHPERCGSHRARRRGAGLHQGPWGAMANGIARPKKGRTPKARSLPLFWAIRGWAVGGAGVVRFTAVFPPSCPRILGMAPLYILWSGAASNGAVQQVIIAARRIGFYRSNGTTALFLFLASHEYFTNLC